MNLLNSRHGEFDRQINTLIQKGYPDITGLSEQAFKALLEPLRAHLNQELRTPSTSEQIPFVITITRTLAPIEKMMNAVERNKKTGIINLTPAVPDDFKPIADVIIPQSTAYLLIDINRGDATRNIAPAQALKIIQQENRSPLTIEEGVAVVTQFPDFLVKNHCFSLLASRRADKRVPAIWLSEGRPKLGWCWDGNPHTWLGSASCKTRVGS